MDRKPSEPDQFQKTTGVLALIAGAGLAVAAWLVLSNTEGGSTTGAGLAGFGVLALAYAALSLHEYRSGVRKLAEWETEHERVEGQRRVRRLERDVEKLSRREGDR